jgi:serine/threonine protein kinase/Tfp pilus assembly protein PilF
MSVDFAKMQDIFLAAVEGHRPEDWGAYLDEACGADDELRHQVNLLLKAHREAGSVPGAALCERERTGPFQTLSEGAGTVIGPYKLMEQIGEGGMGLVFVAEQQQPVRRKVALKVIKPGMDTRQVVARFEAERQALALMDHPNIAKVLDGGTTESGRPYFVMELAKGAPITEYCDQNHVPIRQRLELFLSVCQAVQHAHQKGIIHRDLKPSNILVEIHDVHPVVKIIDFGIAKATGQKLTEKTIYTSVAQMVGTPLYMSPEQAGLSSLDVDTRSDVYSLGVVLYELLTGTTPFASETLKQAGYDEMRRIIREEEPPRPSTRVTTMEQAALSTIAEKRGLEPRRLNQQLRGELDWIVMKALEKDRNRRYDSASALAADVQRYLNDDPVLACPPSKFYRLGKFVRRHKAGLGVAAVLLLAMLLGGRSGLWWLQKQAGAEGEARRALEESSYLLEAEHWYAALSAARRAEGVLAGVGGDAGLRRQIQVLLEDLEMVRRLQEAQLRMTAVKDGRLDIEACAVAYADAFREYGLDVDKLDPHLAAKQIGTRPIRRQLVVALDDWAIALRELKAEGWRQRLAAARAADEDPWRNRLRDWQEGKDPKAVEELAAIDVKKEWPLQTLELLGRLAPMTPSSERVVALLERAQRRHPGDFWINQRLVGLLNRSQPRRLEKEIRFASVAVALQPQGPSAHYNLGLALQNDGQLDEAIYEYAEAIRLKPDDAQFRNTLARLLATCPEVKLRDPNQAVEHAQKAVELAPGQGGFWNTLGVAQYRNGDWKEAVEALMKSSQLRTGGDSSDFFFLAMAQWQLNDKDKARAWYDQAIAWMDKHHSQDKELKRFRAEATALLGLAKAPEAQKKKE